MARYSLEKTMPGSGGTYNLTQGNVTAAYAPNANDKITVVPFDNIKVWVECDTNVWKIHSSDASYTGKVHVVIKT